MNFDKINKTLAKIPEGFQNKEAKVGWFPGAEYEDGPPVAYVALIQEKGAPSVSIPPRPFIRPAIKDGSKHWSAILADGVRKKINGQASAHDVLVTVGEQAAGDIRKKISEIQEPELSPITVMLRSMRRADANLHVTGKTVGEAAERVKAGDKPDAGTPTKPLVDEGLLLNSCTSQVGPKE